MQIRLPESQRSRRRSSGGALVSVALHAALIALAVVATARSRDTPAAGSRSSSSSGSRSGWAGGRREPDREEQEQELGTRNWGKAKSP